MGAGVFPTTSQLRARIHERGATKEFTQLMPNGNVNVNNNMQRGREIPFPARPVLPTSTSSSSTNPTNSSNGVVVGPAGLEARVNVRRYHDLYAAAPAGGWRPEPHQSQRRPPPHQRRSDEECEGGYHAEEEEEEEEEDMKDVLDRFEEDSDYNSDAEYVNPTGRALETRRSFEAAASVKPRSGHESFAVEEYYGTARDTMYSFGGGGDRNSRWSGSVYSRNSILDPDKSEEARERFLERVGAMLGGDEEGRRGQGVVPPVPNIPERFASPRKNWPPGKF